MTVKIKWQLQIIAWIATIKQLNEVLPVKKNQWKEMQHSQVCYYCHYPQQNILNWLNQEGSGISILRKANRISKQCELRPKLVVFERLLLGQPIIEF